MGLVGVGGGSIQTLLKGLLEVPEEPPTPGPAQKDLVRLELVKRTDPIYVQYRKTHYIPDRGVVGGSSAVYTNEFRDQFWELAEEKDLKTRQLNSIINNNIFKLDYPAANLAAIVLGMWRKRVAKDWEELYGVRVAGFETFVVEERLWNRKTRNGAFYRADNWELIGITKGYGDTNVRGRETKNKNLKSKKLVYCKRIKGVDLCTEYETAWGNAQRQRELNRKRDQLITDPLDILLKTIR